MPDPPQVVARIDVPSAYASLSIGPDHIKTQRGFFPRARSASDFETVFEGATLRLKEEQRYRTFVDLERIVGRLPCAIWHSSSGPREVTIWCSNDYLGMSQNTVVVRAMVDAARRLGTGSGGTRNIAGTNHPLVELERELADLHPEASAAWYSTSGYRCKPIQPIDDSAKLISELPDPFRRIETHNSLIEA